MEPDRPQRPGQRLPHRLRLTRRARAGRGSASLFPARTPRRDGQGWVRGPHAPSRVPWRRPSPSPPRTIGKLHRTGFKGPASARPPLGGRFSPARSGAGLSFRVPHRLRLNRRARAGARLCLAFSRPDAVGCVVPEPRPSACRRTCPECPAPRPDRPWFPTALRSFSPARRPRCRCGGWWWSCGPAARPRAACCGRRPSGGRG